MRLIAAARSTVHAPRRLPRRLALVCTTAAATGIMIAPLAAPAQAATTSGEQARSALDFLNSLGVNVHMGYNNTPYADANATVKALRQLGITHVRENIHITSKNAMSRLATLQSDGIRFDFIVPRPDEPGGNDPTPTIDYIAKNFASSTDAIEGPNEYDGSKQTNWASQLRAVQQQVAPDTASRSSLRDALVYGPSLINFKLKKDAPTLGDLSNVLTFGNVHSYPGGQMPETQVESQASLYQQYISAGKPVVATETGYHNAIGDPKNSHPSATERTSGIYYPRLYLEYFRLGVMRTYGYELFDHNTSGPSQEAHFGLFHADGSPKPAAKAISAMTTILADNSQAPGSTLAYSMSDPSAGSKGSNIRHVLLQKSDGTFYLALWRAVSVATPGTGSNPPQDYNVPPQPLSVTFDQPVTSAQSYRPAAGTGVQSSWQRPGTISVPVGPDVTLLKVVPASSGGGGGGPVPAPTSQAPSPAPSPTASPSAGSGSGGGGQPAPSPSQSAPAATPSGGLPTLTLPPLGDFNQTPVHLTELTRLLPPPSSTRLANQTFEVDGKPLNGDVLDPSTLSPGTHQVRFVGRTPAGQAVISAQLVSSEQPLASATSRPTALIAILAAFLLAQFAVWSRLRRVRHATARR